MSEKAAGRRIENFSSADVIAHGREARRRRRPIWTNPFTRERADLWRKGWHRAHDAVADVAPCDDGPFTRNAGLKDPSQDR